MFRQLARLGVTRAAAFFYTVAVGVTCNIAIAHFTPHDVGSHPASAEVKPPPSTPREGPAATAAIAPKPAEPAVPVLVSAKPTTAGEPVASTPAVVPPASAALAAPPSAATSPLETTALPGVALEPEPLPAKPASDSSIEATALPPPGIEAKAPSSAGPAAPIPLLPEPAEAAAPSQPKTKPGPGSGGLY